MIHQKLTLMKTLTLKIHDEIKKRTNINHQNQLFEIFIY